MRFVETLLQAESARDLRLQLQAIAQVVGLLGKRQEFSKLRLGRGRLVVVPECVEVRKHGPLCLRALSGRARSHGQNGDAPENEAMCEHDSP